MGDKEREVFGCVLLDDPCRASTGGIESGGRIFAPWNRKQQHRKKSTMKKWIVIMALCLSAIPTVKASDVYLVNREGYRIEEWHIEDGQNKTWFQSKDRVSCLEQVALLQKVAIYGWDRVMADAIKEGPNK
jgi:beta-lactamase class D